MLDLHAGASVSCAETASDAASWLDETAPFGSPRLVSTRPQQIVIQPEQRLTARVALALVSQRPGAVSQGCSSDVVEPAANEALSRR